MGNKNHNLPVGTTLMCGDFGLFTLLPDVNAPMWSEEQLCLQQEIVWAYEGGELQFMHIHPAAIEKLQANFVDSPWADE